jgi:integrase
MARKAQPRRVRVIRYQLADGTRVPKGTKGAKRVKLLTDTYYFSYRDKEGKVHRESLGTTDLAEAWERLKELKRELKLGSMPVDSLADAAVKPIREVVREWLTTIEGVTPGHIETLKSQMERLIIFGNWKRITDMTADTLRAALGKLKKGKELVAAATRNHYLGTAKQFSAWCLHDPPKLRHDPFKGVKPLNVEKDRRHRRRLPTSEEITKLFAFLDTEFPIGKGGMAPAHRGLAYKLAMGTGLRASEIRSLTASSFDWQRQTVTVAASFSKRRKLDVVPLPAWLAKELREWFEAGGKSWRSLGRMALGKALQCDLRRAGVAYAIDGPRGRECFDFHSLRVWYITVIAMQPGMDPKTLMDLARHSTARLSLEIYARASEEKARQAVANVPPPTK